MAEETLSNQARPISRRDFVRTAVGGTVAMLAGCQIRPLATSTPLPEAAEWVSERPVVSIVKIKRGNIEAAVCETSAEYLERHPVGLGRTAPALNRLDEAWMARSQFVTGVPAVPVDWNAC